MGALPLPKPKAKSRPAFKTYEYDRDILRKQTNYEASPPTGWSPQFNAMIVDKPRLSRSISFSSLIDWIHRYSYGLDQTRPTSTEPLPDEYLAACSAPDASVPASAKLREFQRNCDYGTRAGIFKRRKVGQGYSVFSLCLTDWAKLPDYKDWLKANLHEVAESENEEPSPTDPAQQDTAGDWRLKAPVKIEPGKVAKPHKIDFGVKEFQVDASKSRSEVQYDLRCIAGKFVIFLDVAGNPVPKIGESKANEKRHTRRDFTTSSPEFRQSDREEKANKPAVEHPRAAELGAIFDPLCKKSQVRLLSADDSALKQACDALGDTPRDFLLHFLNAPKGRASRPVSTPLACVAIVKECRQNYLKSRGAEVDTAERDKLVAFLGLPRITRESLKFGGLAKYIDQCRRIVGDPECTREQQDAARVLGRLLAQ